MKSIYVMSMSVNFLLQATRVLHTGSYDSDELKMIYEYIISIDNSTLNEYNDTTNVLSYNNDLELYVEILDVLISIFEEKEEYEKCHLIKLKKDESIIIANKTN